MTDIEMMEVLATVVNQIQQEAAGRRIHCVHTDDALWIFGKKGVLFFCPRFTKFIEGGCILYIAYTLMMHWLFFLRV